MTNASRQYQRISRSSVDTVVDGDLQYAMHQLSNGSKQAVDSAPLLEQHIEFLPSRVADVSDATSVTITIPAAAAALDTLQSESVPAAVADTSNPSSVAITNEIAAAAPDIPQSESPTDSSLYSGQGENAYWCTTHLQIKIFSALSSFLSICLYLLIRIGASKPTSCDSDCD